LSAVQAPAAQQPQALAQRVVLQQAARPVPLQYPATGLPPPQPAGNAMH